VWDLLFAVVLADSLVRFMAALPKAVAVAAFSYWPGGSGRGAVRQQARLLTALEYASQLYRGVLAAPLWWVAAARPGQLPHSWALAPRALPAAAGGRARPLTPAPAPPGPPRRFHYLLACTPSAVLCSVAAGVYLTLKGGSLLRTAQLLAAAAGGVVRRGAPYGAYLAKEEAMEAGGVGGACPICQVSRRAAGGRAPAASTQRRRELTAAAPALPPLQDPVSSGVVLECSHVFCEECIAEWLERDRTCPMCRASVKPPGLQSYSDGTTSLLPQLF
jgi:hypothetical protein